VRILLLEVDGADRFAFATRLEAEGYAVQVTSTVEATRAALGAAPFDCLVLNELIPVLLGEAAVVPMPPRVLVLLPRDKVPSDRVRALELGADDVMAKPVEPVDLREMALRVRNLLRGTLPLLQRPVRLGRVVVFRETRVVTLDGTAVHLTPLQYAVLEQLALMAGEIVSKNVLIERCWVEAGRWEGSPAVHTQVTRLRSIFGAALTIESVYSVGYRLRVPEP
jgi:DNA-binding response OmpR family regulator